MTPEEIDAKLVDLRVRLSRASEWSDVKRIVAETLDVLIAWRAAP